MSKEKLIFSFIKAIVIVSCFSIGYLIVIYPNFFIEFVLAAFPTVLIVFISSIPVIWMWWTDKKEKNHEVII